MRTAAIDGGEPTHIYESDAATRDSRYRRGRPTVNGSRSRLTWRMKPPSPGRPGAARRIRGAVCAGHPAGARLAADPAGLIRDDRPLVAIGRVPYRVAMDVPRLTHVRVNVRDLDAAIGWYERLLGGPGGGALAAGRPNVCALHARSGAIRDRSVRTSSCHGGSIEFRSRRRRWLVGTTARRCRCPRTADGHGVRDPKVHDPRPRRQRARLRAVPSLGWS